MFQNTSLTVEIFVQISVYSNEGFLRFQQR